MARPAARAWQLEDRALPVSPLDAGRCLRESFQSFKSGTRLRICPHRRHNLQSARGCKWRKALSSLQAATAGWQGAEAHAIGRSKGGLSTKIHASVDALGLPIRIVITPGQWGDCPQARGLIEGLTGVGHVMADAAYDADHLRQFIVDDLGGNGANQAKPVSHCQGTHRLGALQGEAFGGVFLQSDQKVPPYCPALRKDSIALPRLCFLSLCYGLAGLNEDAA